MSTTTVIPRCCTEPRLRLTRDERVTRRASLSADGVLLVDDTPLATSGAIFDADDASLTCDTCGTSRALDASSDPDAPPHTVSAEVRHG
jgi:hypothetical protein